MNLRQCAAIAQCVGVALAAACLAPSAFAQAPVQAPRSLGRLFTTPDQREALDRRRQLNIKEAEVVDDLGTTTVNGRVVRSSGRSTTWVNGAPEDDAYRARDADRVAVDGGEGRGQVPLKVGQTLDRTEGRVNDGLNGGHVRVNRAAPDNRGERRQ